QCSGISRLLKILHSSKDTSTQEGSRQTLAILGYSAPVSSHGIKILSIDGGGTRGLVAIDMLRHLEEKTKCPVHELFDLVCGVSTGAIIAVLIGVHRLSLDAIERLYKEISTLIFSQTTIKGTASLVWNNSYYDSDVWTEILKIHMGETPMIETASKEETKKLCLVSTQANSNWVKAFLFRNYNFPYRAASHFNGCSSARLWEGVRASAAAPGYFSEFKLNDLILLDGGVMVNNPTAIALHEARNIWPDTPLQSVVSLGTGRYEPLIIEGDKSINWASRLRTIINSATDTEGVHTTLHDLLPGNVYFRLNPYLSEEITLDETREDKLDCLKKDTSLYVRKNESKLDEAVESLLRPKSLMDKTKDYVTLQKQMYEL
ncbi:Calcium-independent phospholipase A2-gamma, partial [Armadillidium nasatum]